MSIPRSPLTRGQIISQALKRAGNTKDSFRTLATEAFTSILFDLYTQWDWPFLRPSVPLSLVGFIFPLPQDFYRTTDDSSLMLIRLNGEVVRRPVAEMSEEHLALQPHAEGAPIMWCVRRTEGFGYMWPHPSMDCQAVLRYVALPTPLLTDDEFPTFPWSSYLVQEVFCWALDYEGDPRVPQEYAKKEQMLDRIRKVALPNHSQAPDIPLDPTIFGRVFDGDIS